MHIKDDGKMEHLLDPCWEIEQDGQGNSGKKDLYKLWIGEEKVLGFSIVFHGTSKHTLIIQEHLKKQ